MPIYEFECGICGVRSEILAKSGDEKPVCPKCGGRELKKLFSTFSTKGGERPAGHGGACSCCPSGPACPSFSKKAL